MTDGERLTSAAATIGATKAKVDLPPQPDDCRQKEEHAAITEGSEARTILRRERAALDRQNARGERCWQFNEDIRVRFSGAHQTNP